MNFAEAWALCLDGKRIRRASWDRHFFWFLVAGRVTERTDMTGDERWRQVLAATDDELIATDWEEA
jgi:hypothetical protein